MRKWKIILAQFRRERKKIADSKASGSGIGDIYKPKWFAFEHLAFIHGRDCPNVSVNTEWQSNQQGRLAKRQQQKKKKGPLDCQYL
ncbi:hypothetical protein E2C01_034686 [Portunus trituberculatus]|uniref:MADF domain-containing protein n=1 Tax=Portunus trituberculatus TaxID=210409 RepID=A0A5B7F3G2_PORTR|nr:hypothetical protein [Portunus trituberculatus]